LCSGTCLTSCIASAAAAFSSATDVKKCDKGLRVYAKNADDACEWQCTSTPLPSELPACDAQRV